MCIRDRGYSAWQKNFHRQVKKGEKGIQIIAPSQRKDVYKRQIHDYFIVKSLDLVRPGGVVAVITSSRTMDKESEKVRLQFAEKADLLGAIRLPENAFRKNAGTDVVLSLIHISPHGKSSGKSKEPIFRE